MKTLLKNWPLWLFCLVMGLSGTIIQAVIPQVVPTANKRGTGHVFALSTSNTAAAAGSTVCDDGNGNYNTGVSGCVSGSSVSPAAPFISFSGTNYVAADMFPFTALFSGTWINSVSGTVSTAPNGDSIVTAGSTNTTDYFYGTTAAASVEAEFNCHFPGNDTLQCGIWIYDSTNSLLYEFVYHNEATTGAAKLFLYKWTYNGTGSPSSMTLEVEEGPPCSSPVHIKLSASGGDLVPSETCNGGQTYLTYPSGISVGTFASAGISVFTSSTIESVMDALSVIVQ